MYKSLVIFLIVGWVSVGAADTAFDILEDQFNRGRFVSYQSISVGDAWECSSSFSAANEKFRMVQIWDSMFMFAVDEFGVIHNVGQSSEAYPIFVAAEDGSLQAFNQLRDSTKLVLRMNSSGHLVYGEFVQEFDVAEGFEWVARKYAICPKPLERNKSDWDWNTKIWSEIQANN
ncbi:MAG: hypothetical protein R2827_12220 [Bdellovibrionales bacterium]